MIRIMVLGDGAFPAEKSLPQLRFWERQRDNDPIEYLSEGFFCTILLAKP